MMGTLRGFPNPPATDSAGGPGSVHASVGAAVDAAVVAGIGGAGVGGRRVGRRVDPAVAGRSPGTSRAARPGRAASARRRRGTDRIGLVAADHVLKIAARALDAEIR